MRVLTQRTGIPLVTIIYCFLYLTVVPVAGASVQEMIWGDVSNGIKDFNLQVVAVSPDNPEIVYIGSPNAIYKTSDGGKSWDEVLSFRGTGNTINSIAITPLNTKVIYAGTRNGLFRSNDYGIKWEKIFSGIGELKSSILYIAINPVNSENLFIGTGAGLLWTNNGGSDWEKSRDLPSEAVVSFIAIDHSRPQVIYAAADRGLYKSINSGVDWKRIIGTNIPENNTGNEYSTSDQVESEESNGIETKIRGIVIDPADTGTVYVGTSEGLLVAKNGGLTWKMVSSSGLISRDIHHLVISPADPDVVYAATGRGVFRYSRVSGNWLELYNGLTAIDIRFLALVPTIQSRLIQDTNLWAATKKGVFKTVPMVQTSTVSSVEPNVISKNRGMKAEEILSFFAGEPSIAEIQKTAIRYAEVHPEKIEGWRKAAAKRAWLPDLKVEYDKDKDWQSSTYFYSNTTQKYTDDDITSGKDWGWSISLTWELGDLIWNTSQTSIDVRSRLMVQLRDDVLNEVTRLYFARRRLQIEMLLSPSEEIKDKTEKALRLQELTADIDALTGFYLSRNLDQINVKVKR